MVYVFGDDDNGSSGNCSSNGGSDDDDDGSDRYGAAIVLAKENERVRMSRRHNMLCILQWQWRTENF